MIMEISMIYFNANKSVRTEDAGGHGIGGNIKAAIGEYRLSNALIAGQVIPMMALPKGARILDMLISTDGLDQGSALLLDIGDKDIVDRYFTATSIAQDGGVETMKNTDGFAHRLEKTSTINMVVQAAPAQQSTEGVLKLIASYVID